MRILILAALLLAGCSNEPTKTAVTPPVVQRSTPPAPKTTSLPVQPPKAKQAAKLADNADYEDGPNLADPPSHQSLCWQDYCPCDPPREGIDAKLCNRLRAGYRVEPEMLELGSMQRDYHESLDEFHRQYPDAGY